MLLSSMESNIDKSDQLPNIAESKRAKKELVENYESREKHTFNNIEERQDQDTK